MAQRTRTSVASLLVLASALVVLLAAAACIAPETSRDTGAAESDPAPSAVTLAAGPIAAPASDADAVVLFPRGPDGELTALDLVLRIAEETGAEFVLDDACRRHLGSAKAMLCGTHVVRRSELIAWIEAILSVNGVALVPTEGGPPNGRPRWTCVDRRAPAVRPRDAAPAGPSGS